MELRDIITARRSVRAFEGREIEAEKLDKILEAANLAPSAGNLQAYEVYVIRQAAGRAALAKAALDQSFLAGAPVDLVFCTNPERTKWKYGRRGIQLYAIQDATIACTFAMLTAVELGLSSVWVGAFDDDAVRQAIGAPAEITPVAILPLGYPAETPEARPRRLINDLVHWD
jgi:nitroreductase